jgi:esterase/lipase
MDYLGMGDSAKTLREVESLDTWIGNITEAVDHLKSEAGISNVVAIGLRMGANLSATASKSCESIVSSICWDPVEHGSDYLNSLREMHREMLNLWVHRMQTPNDSTKEEILGSLYSRTLLNQIENIKLDLGSLAIPHLVVTDEQSSFTHPESSLQKIIHVEDANSWYDLAELETAWLRPQTVRKIVDQTCEIFERLQRFQTMPSINGSVPIDAPSGVIQ